MSEKCLFFLNQHLIALKNAKTREIAREVMCNFYEKNHEFCLKGVPHGISDILEFENYLSKQVVLESWLCYHNHMN